MNLTKTFSKKVIISTFSMILLIIGIGIFTSTIKLPIESKIMASYKTDFDNNQKLMGASHNVFVGKIIKKVGEEEMGSPNTQFEVEVMYNIKGNLKGNIIVSQPGGYKNGILYKAEGSDLYKPGETRLIATRYREEYDWHYSIPHQNAEKIFSRDKNIKINQLNKLLINDKKIKTLQKAYKNEILLNADVKNNNARNSYKSLQGNKMVSLMLDY